MCKTIRWLLGFAVGAVLGAFVGALLAQRSGPEVRRTICEWALAARDEGRRAAEARRLELTARLDELKRPSASTRIS